MERPLSNVYLLVMLLGLIASLFLTFYNKLLPEIGFGFILIFLLFTIGAVLSATPRDD
jgi:hypothetical protein